ncbi:MAG: hypothetical protein BJ554DRAFT_6895, partial [Olpidium bornovanus]
MPAAAGPSAPQTSSQTEAGAAAAFARTLCKISARASPTSVNTNVAGFAATPDRFNVAAMAEAAIPAIPEWLRMRYKEGGQGYAAIPDMPGRNENVQGRGAVVVGCGRAVMHNLTRAGPSGARNFASQYGLPGMYETSPAVVVGITDVQEADHHPMPSTKGFLPPTAAAGAAAAPAVVASADRPSALPIAACKKWRTSVRQLDTKLLQRLFVRPELEGSQHVRTVPIERGTCRAHPEASGSRAGGSLTVKNPLHLYIFENGQLEALGPIVEER